MITIYEKMWFAVNKSRANSLAYVTYYEDNKAEYLFLGRWKCRYGEIKTRCLTISNALQWRLQYTRAIEWAGNYNGVHSIYRAAFL